MAWQPIETAPLDGTEVILLIEGRVRIGSYDVTEQYRHGVLQSKSEYWYVQSFAIADARPPSHWMAVPALIPATDETSNGEKPVAAIDDIEVAVEGILNDVRDDYRRDGPNSSYFHALAKFSDLIRSFNGLAEALAPMRSGGVVPDRPVLDLREVKAKLAYDGVLNFRVCSGVANSLRRQRHVGSGERRSDDRSAFWGDRQARILSVGRLEASTVAAAGVASSHPAKAGARP